MHIPPKCVYTVGMTTITNPTSHPYYCYCGCKGTVQVSFPGGFNGTTAIVTPCPLAPNYIKAFEIRKSAVLEMTPRSEAYDAQHVDGLITMGVAQ